MPKRTGFQIKLTTAYVDIQYSNGIVKKGYVDISVDKDYIHIYFWRGTSWRWWQGSKSRISAKLSIKFNDLKHMITINNTNKVTFRRPKDYNQIKKKVIFYQLMNANDNKVEFQKRDK